MSGAGAPGPSPCFAEGVASKLALLTLGDPSLPLAVWDSLTAGIVALGVSINGEVGMGLSLGQAGVCPTIPSLTSCWRQSRRPRPGWRGKLRCPVSHEVQTMVL